VSATTEFLGSLIREHLLTEPERNDLVAKYQNDEFAILLHLVRFEPRRRSELGKVWANCRGVAYIEPPKTLMQYELIWKLPEKFAKERKILPLYEFGGAVTVATATPEDAVLVKEVEQMLDAFVSPVFAFPDQIDAALEIAYQSDSDLEKLLDPKLIRAGARDAPISSAELEKLSEETAIVNFTRGMMLLAIKKRASDIHIEPGTKSVRIRFRVDGVLQTVFTLEPALLAPVISRLKVLANADISETRRPQDGRIQLGLPDRYVDFRFSSIPTIHGEKVVLRILGHTQFPDVPDLTELDFSRTVLNEVSRVMKTPNGIFFVTGPTGSGKTTTLYSILKHLNHPGINIVTIEDPVEYTLDGLNQMQAKEDIDLTFASALRSVLRQDPDVILIGEVRDLETAQIAARAALTGHLVLTTMHTNNALQVPLRLLDLGVEPTLVAPSIIGVMAQRLVRRLCENCKERYEPPVAVLDEIFEWDGRKKVEFFKSRGCDRCGQTGYSGRVAIHEIFLLNDEVRALLARSAPAGEVYECAARHGFLPLRYDGLKKVLRGVTTVEEIDRVSLVEE
jgi:type IV pilus assembly protein PilB